MSDRITIEDIHRAASAIAGRVIRTPSVDSAGMTRALGARTALKLETQQIAGCFKPRGIVNKILSLSDREKAEGLVTVSGGNHGIAIAEIAPTMDTRATVVMPQSAPASSIARIRASGADLILAPDSARAFEIAESDEYRSLTYIHSYDDPLIMAGHGTVGLEFINDVPDLTDILVSIGGGALISGIATAVKALNPAVRIWGVETEGAESMSQALEVDRPVQVKVTSISSTLGAPNVTQRTLDHVKALVEEVLLVPDAQAVEGVLTLAEAAKLWVEPAAGCLVPAARRVIERVGSEIRLGLVLCGGNVSFSDVVGWWERFELNQE